MLRNSFQEYHRFLLTIIEFISIIDKGMYDLIRIYQPTKQSASQDYLTRIKPKADLITGEPIIYSKLKNMEITERIGSISIVGSLPKYYFGNNIQTLKRYETKLAIEKIQDEIKINLLNAKIFRMEIGSNFIMKYPFKNYLNFLINAPYTLKGVFSDTTLFKNDIREIIFYGKIKEMIDKKIPVPSRYSKYEETMLRYELRFKKSLKKQFEKSIFVKDLYDREFYCEIVFRWKENYDSVIKMERIVVDRKAYSTPKVYEKFLLSKTINENGLENYLNDIDANTHIFNTRLGADRCKKKIIKLAQLKDYSEPNELIEELNEKVKINADYFLQS